MKQVQLDFMKEHKKQINYDVIPLSDSEKSDDDKIIRMQIIAKEQLVLNHKQ